MQIMTQMAFDGECSQAFEFYAENTIGDSAAKLPPGSTASSPYQIRFAKFRIGDYATLGNDVPQTEHAPMQGFHIALRLKTGDEAQSMFEALTDGGEVETPLSEVAWLAALGTLTDRFGTPILSWHSTFDETCTAAHSI